MFWRPKKTATEEPTTPRGTFEEAKEATRRAAFLNVAQGMTADEDYKQGLLELLRICRSEALATGAAQGRTEAEVDVAIAELCDADTVRLKESSDEEFRQFAQESGDVVKRFLSGP